MNQFNHNLEQMLRDYEALPAIEPAEAWRQATLDRLATTKRDADASFSTKALTFGVLLFIGLNVGFVLKETLPTFKTSEKFKKAPTLNNEREGVFKTIAKELFS